MLTLFGGRLVKERINSTLRLLAIDITVRLLFETDFRFQKAR
jgi:hypothetical protein